MFQHYIGIDISKNWFDVHLNQKVHRVLQKDISLFIQANRSHLNQSLCIMESTGGYERDLALCLTQAGIAVHIAHPNQVASFMRARNRLAKTDAIDARLLSDFGAFLKPSQIRSPRLKERLWLDDMGSRMAQLKDMIHQEHCRSSHPSMKDPFLQSSVQKILSLLETELKACEQAMMDRISQDPVLKQTYEILISMPGVGRVSALTILGGLGEIGCLTKKEVAALVGVAPLTKESGLKRGRGHIMYGRANVRKVLYMSALVACQHNQPMKEFYRRLTEKGKAKKVAIIAVLRKMIVTLNAMVKTGTAWNPQHRSQMNFKDTHINNA